MVVNTYIFFSVGNPLYTTVNEGSSLERPLYKQASDAKNSSQKFDSTLPPTSMVTKDFSAQGDN